MDRQLRGTTLGAAMATKRTETAVAAACLLLGGLYAWGAIAIPGEAGYGGIGPNFLPWLSAAGLLVCGALLLRQARCGGFRGRETPAGARTGHWLPFVWVSAALLINALLITRIGFIGSCTLAFVLAVRGFHIAEGRARPGLRLWIGTAAIGAAISAPVFWLFTKVLGVSLPGLTASGWL